MDYYGPVWTAQPKVSAEQGETTVGYQYDGLTEEDRMVQRILEEHYDKEYRDNISHLNPESYIDSKYFDYTSPNYRWGMSEDQRCIAANTEKRMLKNGGKPLGFLWRYDYALKDYKELYTGPSASTGYVRNTDKEKQYARSVINQQISQLFDRAGIVLPKGADVKFTIDPYTYQVRVSGNLDEDTMSLMEMLLNEGENGKNLWELVWICMHDAGNEIVNSQANMTKADQYSLWHEIFKVTGYDIRNATNKDGTFWTEDGKDLLELIKEKETNSVAFELYYEGLLACAKNGWNRNNDLELEIGFDSSGLYDIGQENGYGTEQDGWIKGETQSIFDARA